MKGFMPEISSTQKSRDFIDFGVSIFNKAPVERHLKDFLGKKVIYLPTTFMK